MYYGYWLWYGPFDIGQTTRNGLGPLKNCRDNPIPALAHEAAKKGAGATSLSNGSLMRITPLAVWAQNLSINDLETCVEADVSMMHSQKPMWHIVTSYCIAIKTLIKNAESPDRATLAL